MRLLQALALLLVFFSLGLGEEENRAEVLLREIAAEDTQKQAVLSEAQQQLRAVQMALREAQAWLDNEDSKEAARHFVLAREMMAMIDEEQRLELGASLRSVERRFLHLARQLLHSSYLEDAAEPTAEEGAPQEE